MYVYIRFNILLQLLNILAIGNGTSISSNKIYTPAVTMTTVYMYILWHCDYWYWTRVRKSNNAIKNYF